MEDLLVRVNMAALSLLATKTPQAGDVNANFAELKAVINGLKDRKRGNDGNNSGVSGYSAAPIRRQNKYPRDNKCSADAFACE